MNGAAWLTVCNSSKLTKWEEHKRLDIVLCEILNSRTGITDK